MVLKNENDAAILVSKCTKLSTENIIPNMHLKNEGIPEGFVSNKEDYEYWQDYIYNRN